MAKRESAIVAEIRRGLHRLGYWTVKIHGDQYQPSGVPDLLCCVEGRFVAFEVKRPGEEPTPLQLYTIGEIRQAGGIAEVVESLEDCLRVLASKSLYGFRGQG